MIPYGKQWIDDDDIQSVVDVLKSDWLTTGPKIDEFEQAVANFTGSTYAVAVSSGTAALHAAMFAINIQSGDEVIVPAMTFAATANCIVFQGGTPVFADVDPYTLLIDTLDVERKINASTKAIISVDYAGQPADYDVLNQIADKNGLVLVADACHAIGGSYKERPVGSLAGLNAFSFHPVKHITTGEGGMITTDNEDFSRRMKIFRNHGITTDHRQRAEQGSWFYEMMELGYNYRITDFQCALGISQLKKLPQWIKRRQKIAKQYDDAYKNNEYIQPLSIASNVKHAYHLYVVRVKFERLGINKDDLFVLLRKNGIGVNVHYIPVYFHPYYQTNFGLKKGLCPVAEEAYNEILSLPIFPKMIDQDIDKVIDMFISIIEKESK
ncbi:MAG: UDP-4-amino-4,6-dideoxy-N-acetyl-beta-L-altrosamine transaminase [Candidatus Cloacimonetes bacterium]|nr:UDP-4-amino-4,6-dideoxy-N-acetyl-beta-L-altrosamine transaminase [Candidatus Cloacimonadota bacterium]